MNLFPYDYNRHSDAGHSAPGWAGLGWEYESGPVEKAGHRGRFPTVAGPGTGCFPTVKSLDWGRLYPLRSGFGRSLDSLGNQSAGWRGRVVADRRDDEHPVLPGDRSYAGDTSGGNGVIRYICIPFASVSEGVLRVALPGGNGIRVAVENRPRCVREEFSCSKMARFGA